jgi:hypothetical protein
MFSGDGLECSGFSVPDITFVFSGGSGSDAFLTDSDKGTTGAGGPDLTSVEKV